MSAAAPGVLDYLMGTSFPTALSTFVDGSGNGPTIYFGPGLPKFTSQITLQCHGIKFSETWAEIAPSYNYEETATVPCTLTAWVGGQADNQAWLDRKNDCFSALSLVLVNLGNDVTLNGLVRWVRFEMGQFMPAESRDSGSMGHLDFELSYRVRVSSMTSQANVY